MNYIEEAIKQQEAAETFWPSFMGVASALGVAMIVCYLSPQQITYANSFEAQSSKSSGTTQTIAIASEPTDKDILLELNRVYNYLSQPKELDHDARKILYSNLWSLFE